VVSVTQTATKGYIKTFLAVTGSAVATVSSTLNIPRLKFIGDFVVLIGAESRRVAIELSDRVARSVAEFRSAKADASARVTKASADDTTSSATAPDRTTKV